MKRGFLANDSAFFKLFISCILIFACLSISFIISFLLAIPIFNLDFLEIISKLSELEDSGNIQLLRYFQLVQSMGLFIIPPFILAYAFSKNALNYLQLNRNPFIYATIIVIITILVSLPIINYLAELNSRLKLPESLYKIEEWMLDKERIAEKITKTFLVVETLDGFLLNLFMISILPAIGEELLFRGILQRLLIDFFKSKHIGVLTGAIIFSAFHLQFYGFLPRMLLGLYLGYILLWGENIWLPIIAHLVNNATAVIYYYLITKKDISIDLENIGATTKTFWYVPISGALLIILIWMIYRIYFKSKRPSHSL